MTTLRVEALEQARARRSEIEQTLKAHPWCEDILRTFTILVRYRNIEHYEYIEAGEYLYDFARISREHSFLKVVLALTDAYVDRKIAYLELLPAESFLEELGYYRVEDFISAQTQKKRVRSLKHYELVEFEFLRILRPSGRLDSEKSEEDLEMILKVLQAAVAEFSRFNGVM